MKNEGQENIYVCMCGCVICCIMLQIVCLSCVSHELIGVVNVCVLACLWQSRNFAAFRVTCRCGFCVVYIVEFCAMCFSLGCPFNSLCVLSQVFKLIFNLTLSTQPKGGLQQAGS